MGAVDAAMANAAMSMAHDFDDIVWMGHACHSAVFASLEAWMGSAGQDGGDDIDELSRLTDIALSALEDGLTATLRHAGLD